MRILEGLGSGSGSSGNNNNNNDNRHPLDAFHRQGPRIRQTARKSTGGARPAAPVNQLAPGIMNELQQLRAEVEASGQAVSSRITTLQDRVNNMRAEIDNLTAAVSTLIATVRALKNAIERSEPEG